jgi:hypothetical protein
MGMVVDDGSTAQSVLGVFLMEKEDQWIYPANSPFAGEPLSPRACEMIEYILEVHPTLTLEKAIEITWAFGGI